MAKHPNNTFYDLEKAKDYLEFALQFTPQYGDSFLEMMRLTLIKNEPTMEEDLLQMRQVCIHSEPNYGLLWFYHKNSITDNAYDIWERTLGEMRVTVPEEELNVNGNNLVSEQESPQENWLGSQRLIKLLRSGIKIQAQ